MKANEALKRSVSIAFGSCTSLAMPWLMLARMAGRCRGLYRHRLRPERCRAAKPVAPRRRPAAADLPKLGALIDDSEADVLAHLSFPAAHRAKLHSANPLERLNGEIKRRTDVVGIFPDEAAITRLVGALLLEQNDEWAVQRTRYMTLETMRPSATVPTSACRSWRPDPAGPAGRRGDQRQLHHTRGRDNVKKGTRQVELGHSMRSWLSRMGVAIGGKNLAEVRAQARQIPTVFNPCLIRGSFWSSAKARKIRLYEAAFRVAPRTRSWLSSFPKRSLTQSKTGRCLFPRPRSGLSVSSLSAIDLYLWLRV